MKRTHCLYVQPTAEPFFAGLVEHAFFEMRLAVDPPVLEYLTALLTRFIHLENVYRARTLAGKRITSVVDMLGEANACIGEAKRKRLQHIGDFTLFWVGVYPEALKTLPDSEQVDYFFVYSEAGKRAYSKASELFPDSEGTRGSVLAQLSDHYDCWSYGLRWVREAWERDAEKNPAPS